MSELEPARIFLEILERWHAHLLTRPQNGGASPGAKLRGASPTPIAPFRMTIRVEGDHVESELFVGAPYDFVVEFIAAEIGHRVDDVTVWLGAVRQALAGQPVEAFQGNAWYLEADAQTASLVNDLVGPPDRVERLSTSVLLEILERWAAFLESRGYTPFPLARDREV